MLSLDINIVFTILNLIIFYQLLKKFLFKPIQNIMEKRKEYLASQQQAAEQMKEDAEALKKQYEEMIDKVGEEGEKILDDSRVKAEEEYENFRYSVLYRNIQKAYRKQKSKQENAQVAVGVYKALRFGLLCFNLMNGNSDSGSDLGSSMDFSGVDLGNLDLPDNMSLANLDENPAFIDYLTSPADQVSFGNSYDNNAVDFLKTCKEHGVDLPNNVNTSTNSYTTVVDRDYNGGLTGIDKTLIGHKLDNMLKAGDLSQNDFDELKSKLSKT